MLTISSVARRSSAFYHTSTRFLHSYGCSIESYGAPLKSCSVALEEIQFRDDSDDILLQTHAAPINPSDINIIEGKYAVLPESLPAFAGNEGLLQVQSIGSKCSNALREGQFVIPSTSLLGTWRQHVVCKESDVIPLDLSMDDMDGKYDSHAMAQLSMIAVNPSTAYRMINDFVSLEQDDWIIQNAANSAVGECVIQLSKHFGFKTVNIIRGSVDGDDHRSEIEFEKIRNHLLSLGADVVIGDGDMKTMSRSDRSEMVNGRPPTLALNAVSGPVVNEMVKWMTSEQRSVLVTYGGMSKLPLQIATAPFIFRDLTLTGFWMTAWKKRCELDANLKREYLDMVQYLTTMIRNRELGMSYSLVRFGESGEGMMSGLKQAVNAAIEDDDLKHIVNVEGNATPLGIRGKVVMSFQN